MVTAVRALVWQKETARCDGWLVCGTVVSWALAIRFVDHEGRCKFNLVRRLDLGEGLFLFTLREPNSVRLAAWLPRHLPLWHLCMASAPLKLRMTSF